MDPSEFPDYTTSLYVDDVIRTVQRQYKTPRQIENLMLYVPILAAVDGYGSFISDA